MDGIDHKAVDQLTDDDCQEHTRGDHYRIYFPLPIQGLPCQGKNQSDNQDTQCRQTQESLAQQRSLHIGCGCLANQPDPPLNGDVNPVMSPSR